MGSAAYFWISAVYRASGGTSLQRGLFASKIFMRSSKRAYW